MHAFGKEPKRSFIGSSANEHVEIEKKKVTRVQLAEHRVPWFHSINSNAHVVFAIRVPTSEMHVQQIDLALSF